MSAKSVLNRQQSFGCGTGQGLFLTAAVVLTWASPSQADPIGVFAFLPPFSTGLPTGATASFDTKGITLSGEGEMQLRIGGRLQEDFGAAAVTPHGGVPNSRDVDTRRAWFESYLTLPYDVHAAFQYDFNSAAAPIKDAAVIYKGIPNTVVSVGNVKETFSIDRLTSSNSLLFVERAQLDAFSSSRNFGFAGGTHGDRWTLSGGVFGEDANAGIVNDGVGGTARATYAPIMTADQVLHFGLAGAYRALGRNGPALSYTRTPDDFLFRKALVDTGAIRGAESFARVDAEFAYSHGPFRAQAEYAALSVGVAGGASRVFQAAYIQAAYVFNGQGPAYKLQPAGATEWATFRGIEITDEQRVSRGGIGVFEIGARIDSIDLNSGAVRGGAERNATLGLNWYPERNIRLMADYIHVLASPSAASVTGRTVRDDSFVGRLQLYW